MHILYFLISRPHQRRAAVPFLISILNKMMCHLNKGRSISVSLFGPVKTAPSPTVWRHQTYRNEKKTFLYFFFMDKKQKERDQYKNCPFFISVFHIISPETDWYFNFTAGLDKNKITTLCQEEKKIAGMPQLFLFIVCIWMLFIVWQHCTELLMYLLQML